MRRNFDSSKVRGEENSVIHVHVFTNWEILPRPEDARICFTFVNDNERF